MALWNYKLEWTALLENYPREFLIIKKYRRGREKK